MHLPFRSFAISMGLALPLWAAAPVVSGISAIFRRLILTLSVVCFVGVLHAQRDYSSAYAFSTLAGSGIRGSANGTGTAASFYNPTGVAVDASGNVYVADTANYTIRKITSAGVVTTFAGMVGATTGTDNTFNNPGGVAVDRSGYVYVADNHKIRRISPAGGVGGVDTLAGSGIYGFADGAGTLARFNGPSSIAVDASGNVYVADTNNQKVRRVMGNFVSTLAGSGGQGSADGTSTAASFFNPSGVAVDSSGNVYVADYGNHKIRKISAAGVVTTLAGSGSSGHKDGTGTSAIFNNPHGVAVDVSGNVYVADTGNNTIRKITAAGVVRTLARPGQGLTSPFGVAVDASGNLYATSYNSTILKGVALQTQTLSFAAIADKTCGSTFTLSAIANSGLTPTFSIVSGPASLSGNSITLTGLGVVTVRAFQAGDASYAEAPPVDQSFMVIQGTQAINFEPLLNKTYGDAAFPLSASVSSGLIPVFSVVSGPATLNGNALTITGVGTIVVRASQPGNANYAAAAPVDQSFVVAKANQTITFAGLPNRTYGDAAFTVSATSSIGLAPTFSILSGPATITGNTVTLTGAGTVTVRATQAGNANYAPAVPVDQSFAVAKASQTITFAVLPNRTYGDAAFTLSATASSGLIPVFSFVSGPATLNGNTLTMTGAGTVVIRASQPGDGNYTAATAVDRSFVVRNTQTITFPSIVDRLLTAPTVNLTATSSSGLSVAYAVVSGPATVTGSTLTLTGEGAVTVSASQAGDFSYAPATSVIQSFNATKAAQTVTFPSIGDRLLNNPTVTLAATASSGLAVTYAVVSGPVAISGSTLTLIGEGVVTVSASQVGSFGYSAASASQSFKVSKAAQTITFPSISNRLRSSNSSIQLTANSSSGLPISYSIASGPATVSGSTLTVTGTGSITVLASQEGSGGYLPAADVPVSFTVYPNTGSPAALSLSKSWFYDNTALNTLIGTVTAVDPDIGDTISYSLVAGSGSTDNAKFSLSGNSLRTKATFNYDTKRSASIRLRATDSLGQYTEQSFTLTLVDATPWAQFELKGKAFTDLPSYVNVIFQLKDNTGRGINLPRELFDLANDQFTVQEDMATISPSESFLQVNKKDEVPTKVRTILLLDTSFSVGANLGTIKTAAKTLVDSMFDRQEIAVYSFSGSAPILVKDFTSKSPADQLALKTAIDAVTLGSPSTNLYGSVLAMLNLPQWKESFTLNGIETGFLVVLTDGQDTSGLATLDQVVAKRNADNKQIFAVGLGADINPTALNSLQNADTGYKPVASVDLLAAAFAEIQNIIEDGANSFYWLNYASPKRGNFDRLLTVGLKNNSNTTATGTLSTTFNSNGFSDVQGYVMINRKVNATAGVTSLTIPKDTVSTANAFTMLGFYGTPSYTWSIGNSSLASLSPVGSNGGQVSIIPKGINGTTILTLKDNVNINLAPKTITLKVGSGVAPLPQTITFGSLANRTQASPAFNLVATASSGLPVSFTLVSGPATISGSTVSLTGAIGTVLIRASQAGDDTYAAASLERSFDVTVPNKAPDATPSSISAAEDTTMKITLAGTDPEGSPLTYSIVTAPAKGALTGTAPNVTYKPNANFNGTDSFTFRVNDGITNSATATVSLKITAVNDAPVATAKSVTTKKNTSVAISLKGSDTEGSTLKYSVAKAPAHGSLSGTAPKLTYKPKTGYTGADSFTFRVNDGTVNSATATVKITVGTAAAAPAPQLALTAQPTQTLNKTTVPDPYLAWCSRFFIQSAPSDPLVSGENSDPDHDGLPNILEFLLGGNPTDYGNAPAPALTINPGSNSQTLVYSYNRQINASGVTQVIEHTADLSSAWTPAVHGQNGVTVTITPIDVTTELVTITIPSTGSSRFVRLKAMR